MRTSWLVLSALLLLVAPGCGDDATTPMKDQGVTVVDMAMTAPGDMSHKTCAAAFTCSIGCASAMTKTPEQCAAQCSVGLTGTSQQYFGLLFQCLAKNCISDAGVASELVCLTNAIMPTGVCGTETTTCKNDK